MLEYIKPEPVSIGPSNWLLAGKVAAVLGPEVIKARPTLAELFGSLDLCECQHCRSVLSPAAYFVDLLQFLNPPTGAKPLGTLLARRPDLQHIKLSCENTNTPIPYVDLVNEILESYVALKGKLDSTTAKDTGDATAEELAANPQYTENRAYWALARQVYPWRLPFHQPLESARIYLEHLGTTRSEVMEVFGKGSAVALRAIDAEYLKISAEEYAILTGHDFALTTVAVPLRARYGYGAEEETQTRMVPKVDPNTNQIEMIFEEKPWHGWLAGARELMQRADLSYADVVELLKTRFINPDVWLLEVLHDLDITYEAVAAVAGGSIFMPTEVTDALDVRHIPAADFRAWAQALYPRMQKAMVLAAPGDGCDLSLTWIRHRDGSELTQEPFAKLHRFVRLARKLGWTFADLDKAMTALKADDVTPDLMHKLARVQLLKGGLKQPLLELLSLWGNIDTHGEVALYRKLFLSKAVRSIDTVFEPDWRGAVLRKTGETISKHVPALVAALRISADELDLIRDDAKLDDDEVNNDEAALNLQSLSVLYRYAALGRALKLRVRELLSLKMLYGLDPLLDPFESPDATRDFVELVAKVRKSGFSVAQLNYLYRHLSEPPADFAPRRDALLQLARSIREGLVKIDGENMLSDDPKGELTRSKLGLLFEGPVVDQIVQMLDGSAVYSAVLQGPAPVPAPALALPAAGSVFYDPGATKLKCVGPISEGVRALLLSLSSASAFHKAVGELFQKAEHATPNETNEVDLAAAPPLGFAGSGNGRIFYRGSPAELQVIGPLTDAEGELLKSLSPDDAAYKTAVKEILEQPRTFLRDTFGGPQGANGGPVLLDLDIEDAVAALLDGQPVNGKPLTTGGKFAYVLEHAAETSPDGVLDDRFRNSVALAKE